MAIGKKAQCFPAVTRIGFRTGVSGAGRDPLLPDKVPTTFKLRSLGIRGRSHDDIFA